MKKKSSESIEIRPGEFEPLSESLNERSNGDKETAAFFHCLGRAIAGEPVNSKYLTANSDVDIKNS